MRLTSWKTIVLVITVVLIGVLFKQYAVTAKTLNTPTASITTPIQTAAGLTPNEMGRIMILEYHLIGTPEAEWRRTPDNFRKDLDMLHENGYYPIPLEDMVSGNLKVPAGKTPFVITFDDSSQGQFRYLKQGDKLVVDPNCAIGIMEDFKKRYSDFPLTATFYVLPEIPKGLRLFGQEEYIKQKLVYLAEHGYEIGNHTYWHQNLGKTDDNGVQKQIALAVKEIQSYVPGYNVHSMALPLGVHAKNQALEREGEYQGIKYHNDSILLVGSDSAPSPYSSGFNPYRLERIQAGDTIWGPKACVERYRRNPELRFVSDGDPAKITIPKAQEGKINIKAKTKYKLEFLEPMKSSPPTAGVKVKTKM